MSLRLENVRTGNLRLPKKELVKVKGLSTSPKEFSASKCDVGNWILSKSWEFFVKLFGNFMEFFGSLLKIFWEFFGNFGGNIWAFFGEFLFFGNSLGMSAMSLLH